MNLGRPVWVDDPHFNLEYHVRHSALPAPGSAADLRRLMGRLMSQELDRNRPLWEAWVVEGLEGDRWALISKMHHCMVDGVAGVDLISVVLDHDRLPSPPIVDDWDPEEEPSSLRLAADAPSTSRPVPVSSCAAARTRYACPEANAAAWARHRRLAPLVRIGCCVPLPRPRSTAAIGPHRRWTFAGRQARRRPHRSVTPSAAP